MIKEDWFKPQLTPNKGKPRKYDVHSMTLSQALIVMCEHFFTFEQIREMTFEQIGATFERINAGEIKSVREVEEENKKKRIGGAK